MWCQHCQQWVDPATPGSVEQYRGHVPLAESTPEMSCPQCSKLFKSPAPEPAQETVADADAAHAQLDPWEEAVEEQLQGACELLAESRRLRESVSRIDRPRQPTKPVASDRSANRSGISPQPMQRFPAGALPRTPAVILFMLGVGLLSSSWIRGFEAIGSVGLSVEWVGQMILMAGGLLWLRDAMRSEREMSGKLDATIAGLHVLRRDFAAPPEPHDAHRQLADLKRRLSAITRSFPC